ncbi:hypothetical protein LNP17_07455 [Klebsiella variicola subsp. variicola]|nr:hypothetical protein [Klebsiella variicola subsp. variicola]
MPGTPCAPDRQNGIWIVQAHEWGKYVGRADFEFRNGEMKLVHYQLIPVNLKKKVTYDNGQSERVLYTPQIAENPQMMSLLTPFQNKGKAQLQVKIGSVNGHLEGDRSKVRFVQTQYGAPAAGGADGAQQCGFRGDERRWDPRLDRGGGYHL